MYIESVPNRGSPPAILLRESFRADGRVRKRTLANLSAWPTALVEGFRTLLKGGVAVAADRIRIRRALPHGDAVAVLGTLRAIGLDRLLGKPADRRLAPLAMALIAARLIAPASKLATARELAVGTAGSSLGRLLRLGAVDEVELYRALDWLGARQSAIETALARRHLKDGALVLYDVSSSWLEGRCCELARFGHSRDGKKGKLQIVYGLLCAADGCPVAVEEVARIVGHLRACWPRVRILLRADAGFAREQLMHWCEHNSVDFLFGLAKNARLTWGTDLPARSYRDRRGPPQVVHGRSA